MHEFTSRRRWRLPAGTGRFAVSVAACLCAGQLLTASPVAAGAATGTAARTATSPAPMAAAAATGSGAAQAPSPAAAAPRPAAPAPVRPRVRLKVSTTRPVQGRKVTFTARVTAPVARRTAFLQVRRPDGWHNIAARRLTAAGEASWRLRQPVIRRYRVAYPAQQAAGRTVSLAAQSGSVKIRPRHIGTEVLAEASTLRGRPYRWGAAGPKAFDCSGLTRYVFRKFGKKLPHNANAQQRYGRAVPKSKAKVGDLVFFRQGTYAYHVGIYAGNGYIFDAPRPGQTVGKRKIWTAYVVRRVLG
ncbi:MAG TPA: C40 family peptidase [Pilimelia sp.]|nr:C40 family peptidase [Pilimelia sp.]